MKILITGASRGIGQAEAKLLDKNRNELFLVASKKESFKEATLKGQHLFGYDLTDKNNINSFVADLSSQTSSIDVLVNNVGLFVLKKFTEMSEDEIETQLNLNIRSHILLTKKLLPFLKKSGNPQIIFMSSMAAKSAIVGESVYSATKGAVTNFASALRNELALEIKVSTVHAWGVNTWNDKNPGVLLKPENIAEAVEFIITREKNFLVESIDLGNIHQWRGAHAPWSPK